MKRCNLATHILISSPFACLYFHRRFFYRLFYYFASKAVGATTAPCKLYNCCHIFDMKCVCMCCMLHMLKLPLISALICFNISHPKFSSHTHTHTHSYAIVRLQRFTGVAFNVAFRNRQWRRMQNFYALINVKQKQKYKCNNSNSHDFADDNSLLRVLVLITLLLRGYLLLHCLSFAVICN